MKKPICYVALFSLLSLSCFAQTKRGTVLVGLAGNASFTKNFSFKSSNSTFSPRVGAFLAKNLALGGQMSFDRQTSEFHGFSNNYNRTIESSVSAFARYYFGEAKLKPFVTAQTGYSWLRTRSTAPDRRGYFRGDEKWQAAVGAGLAWFVAPKVAIEVEANYRFLNRSEVKILDNGNQNFRLGLALYLKT